MEDVNSELQHRSRITGIYNKARDAFDSKEDYDNYLEAVEDIIYKLTSNIDVAEVEQQVQDYIRQEAAIAGAAAPDAGAYVSSSAAGSAIQPVPLVPVQMDEQGTLQPLKPLASFTREQWQLMARASAWSPELATRRALEDAFCAILL